MTISTLAPRARRKMQPPPPPDPITQYALDVIGGRIVAGACVSPSARSGLMVERDNAVDQLERDIGLPARLRVAGDG